VKHVQPPYQRPTFAYLECPGPRGRRARRGRRKSSSSRTNKLRKRPSTQTVPAAPQTQTDAAGRVAGAGRGDVRGGSEPIVKGGRTAGRTRRCGFGAQGAEPATRSKSGPRLPSRARRTKQRHKPPGTRQRNKATSHITQHASEKLGQCHEHRHQSEEQSNTTHRPARAKRMTAPRTLVRVRINKAALGRGDQSLGPDPWTKCQKQSI